MLNYCCAYCVIAIVCLVSVASINAMVLPGDATNRTDASATIDYYVDPNGVKVEKQSVDAVVVGEGFVNETDSRWDYENQDENYFTDEEEPSSYEENSDNNADRNSDSSSNSNSGGGFFNSPTNIFDLIASVQKAWGVVEEHRKMWADKARSANNQVSEEDRLKRNSMFQDNDQFTLDTKKEQVDSLTPAPIITETSTKTAVAEGRYIKGDPLKGYYDFVITEGSYKFWAAFQLATAVLVIYSTFAAIYYSKVNPIVGDYDYVDYLGGGRSLSDGNVDYVDPSEDEPSKGSSTVNTQKMESGSSTWSSWSPVSWLPTIGKTTKSVLQLIDKLS